MGHPLAPVLTTHAQVDDHHRPTRDAVGEVAGNFAICSRRQDVAITGELLERPPWQEPQRAAVSPVQLKHVVQVVRRRGNWTHDIGGRTGHHRPLQRSAAVEPGLLRHPLTLAMVPRPVLRDDQGRRCQRHPFGGFGSEP